MSDEKYVPKAGEWVYHMSNNEIRYSLINEINITGSGKVEYLAVTALVDREHKYTFGGEVFRTLDDIADHLIARFDND